MNCSLLPNQEASPAAVLAAHDAQPLFLVDGRQRAPDAWRSFAPEDVEGLTMAETVLAGVLAGISSPLALAYPGVRSWRFNDVLCWNFPEAQKLITRVREKRGREAWKKNHPDAAREEKQRYRAAHPEKIAAAKKEWKRENPDKVKAGKARRAFRDYERPFVAIDFEGRTFLDDDVVYPLKNGAIAPNSATYPKHRIILGGAGGWARTNDPVALARIEKEGEHDAAEKARHAALMREGELLPFEWLSHDDESPLTSIETIEWLLSLPKKFGDVNFVAFVFNYDVTQILAELPRATAFEVCKSRIFDGSPYGGKKFKAPVFYGPYAIRYIKSKIFELWRLADPDKPYKLKTRSDGRPFLDKKGKPVKMIDASEHIAIHDTWGFWQKPFTVVSEALAKDGYFDAGDHKTIVKHKADRSHFATTPMEEIRHYCGLELHALSKAATVLRDCFDKIPTGAGREPGLRLRAWCGAGSASSALFRKVGLKKDHFPDEEIAVRTANIPKFQTAAFHAYFGGNIQLIKQGYAPKTPLWGYDLSSAYPWGCLELPSMKGGKWAHDKKISFLNDNFVQSKEAVANSNVLDMFRVRWCFPLGPKPVYDRKTRDYDRPRPFPFFPLPYRKTNGGILFPSAGLTWIMRDELLGALRWVETFFPDPKAREQISDFTILETWRFTPATDEKPFAFVAELYAARGETPKSDPLNNALKLLLTSFYGKLAQSVGGGEDEPPPSANPFYAAAITAACRRRVMEAALLAPYDVVMFATDGIVSTKMLPGLERVRDIDKGEVAELGDWEMNRLGGGFFLQSGVYVLYDPKGAVKTKKTRGVNPLDMLMKGDLDKYLVGEVLPQWRKAMVKHDKSTWPRITIKQRQYVTAGSAVVSPERWKLAGRWADVKRDVDVHNLGVKRALIDECPWLYISHDESSGAPPLTADDLKEIAELLDAPLQAVARCYAAGEAFRCRFLVPTIPATNKTPLVLSAPRMPEWSDPAYEEDMAQLEIACGEE